jgi:hypothetical protein
MIFSFLIFQEHSFNLLHRNKKSSKHVVLSSKTLFGTSILKDNFLFVTMMESWTFLEGSIFVFVTMMEFLFMIFQSSAWKEWFFNFLNQNLMENTKSYKIVNHCEMEYFFINWKRGEVYGPSNLKSDRWNWWIYLFLKFFKGWMSQWS